MKAKTNEGALKLVLSGYYGFRNSGDEAVLLSILTALEQASKEAGVAVEPIVLSGDPAWTEKMYGVRAAPRMGIGSLRRTLSASDGLVSGGGSLLQDATGLGSIPYYLGVMRIARWYGKPTYVYAQGIGPVNRGLFRPWIAGSFRKAAYVSVRDAESAELLGRFGVPQDRIDVVSDPVLGLPLPAGAAPAAAGTAAAGDLAAAEGARTDAPPLVGVSVRFWRGDRADLDRTVAALAALAGRRSVRLRLLPFHHGSDEEASRYVMERLALAGVASELAPAHEAPQAMLREVDRCDLLVGMRLHSLIYAANREVPLLGISYDPKIDQFLGRLGARAVGTTEELDPERFARQAAAMLNDPLEWRGATLGAINRLKNEAIRPAQRIVEHLTASNRR